MINELKFLLTIRNLSNIERCANVLHIQRYNVAEHSFYLAFYALFFAELENRRLIEIEPEAVEPNLYDCKKLLYKAIIHDMEESVTGDILYPIKHRVNFQEAIVDAAEKNLLKNLKPEIARKYIQIWVQAKDDTREGRMIEAMDKFELLVFAFSELMLGNHAFTKMYETALVIIRENFGGILSLQHIIDDMEQERYNDFAALTLI